MKRYLYLLPVMLMFLMIACSKGSSSTGTTMNPPPPPPPAPKDTTLYQGSFTKAAHSTSGKAIIRYHNGSEELSLENFMTEDGPDLYVYLSDDAQASAYVSLGKLKSISGDQVYSITGMPDFNKYHYVLIWCQAFGVLFGSAQLQ